MKDKIKYLKYPIEFILATVAFSILLSDKNASAPTRVFINEPIFKTVAHIPAENVSNSTLLYRDTENDIAYYVRNNDYVPVTVGDMVRCDTSKYYKVVATFYNGFYIDGSDGSISAGMSGTPVLFNGVTVGYISSISEDYIVTCIWA